MTATDGRPSERERRYDRQLRMWGDHGQRDLERAHVCLIGATSAGEEIDFQFSLSESLVLAGCETLKNLILPGIGAFTIIDWRPVSCDDVGVNYFLREDDLGKNRAEAVKEHLNVSHHFSFLRLLTLSM